MTRAMKMSAYVAMGLLMTAATVAAQKVPATTSGGEITISTLGTGSFGVNSSKFTEYREVSKGTTVPYMNLWARGSRADFSLTAFNASQTDQRYIGQLKGSDMALKFNFNSIPHNMGNDGRTIFNNSGPGVWTMSPTLKTSLQNTLNGTLPTSARTYDWYSAVLAPTFATANQIDVSGVRKTGNVELNLGKKLPLDVTLSYKNEAKTGYRGLGSVNVRGTASTSTEFANPLDEITQDFGIRAAKNFKQPNVQGSVYATFNRNVYNNRAERVIVDYPFQGVDALATPAAGAIPAMGGTSKEQYVMAPDNQANMSTAGFLLKFKKQTRVGAGVALSQLTQDAAFFPYTANSVLLTAGGLQANSIGALQQKSYGGKVNTTMYNLSFSTKPVEGLDLRAQYRVYDLKDKSNKWVITGDVSGSNSVWGVITPTAADPYGHATANVYDTKSSRLTASATYDFRALTIEGQVRTGTLDRTSREATSGTESGAGVTALYHASDWLGVRGTFDQGKRTAKGETLYGFQSDEAAFTNKRTGVDVELSPAPGLELTIAYFRRDVEYTDRPNRIAVSAGKVITGAVAIPNTPSGLLDAKYDSYTGEFSYAPNEKIEVGAYYTYEKDATTNQWSTTNSATATVNPLGLNNLLRYAGSDKTNTFGANAILHLVPDKHSVMFSAMNQNVDGLLDVTANASGTFYNPGRTTLIPAGGKNAVPVDDWDDTKLTTVTAQYDWTVTKAWMLSAGYMYEKYDFKDAYNASSNLMTAAPNIFMKPNFGAYDSNLFFARVNVKF